MSWRRTPWYSGPGLPTELPYQDMFNPSDKSNDDKLPTKNQDFVWYEKYRCQTCDDDDGLDFNSTTEELVEHRRFLIYRLPFMKIVNGKRSCPECVHNDLSKKHFKASSDLVTKTDAMKTYKLKKEEIETLDVAKTTSGKYGMIRLYNRDECKELGKAKQKRKEDLKRQKEEDKKKKATKSGKNPLKSMAKNAGGNRVTPYSKSPSKRGRKSMISIESEEEGEDTEEENLDLDMEAYETVKPNESRSSRRTSQKINYEEPMDEEDDGGARAATEIPQPTEKSEPDTNAQNNDQISDVPTPRVRGRPRKALVPSPQADSFTISALSRRGRGRPKKLSA